MNRFHLRLLLLFHVIDTHTIRRDIGATWRRNYVGLIIARMYLCAVCSVGLYTSDIPVLADISGHRTSQGAG